MKKDKVQSELMKEYRNGVIATLKKYWVWYTVTIIVLSGFSTVQSMPKLLRILSLIVCGLLVGAHIIYKNKAILKKLKDNTDKKSKFSYRTRVAINIVVILLSFTLTSWAINSMTNNNDLKKTEGYKASVKAGSISQCKQQLPDTITADKKQAYCGCAMDTLLQKVGDRFYTEEYNNELSKNGLDQQTSDELVQRCGAYVQ